MSAIERECFGLGKSLAFVDKRLAVSRLMLGRSRMHFFVGDVGGWLISGNPLESSARRLMSQGKIAGFIVRRRLRQLEGFFSSVCLQHTHYAT